MANVSKIENVKFLDKSGIKQMYKRIDEKMQNHHDGLSDLFLYYWQPNIFKSVVNLPSGITGVAKENCFVYQADFKTHVNSHTIEFIYKTGTHGLNILGVDILNNKLDVVSSSYHWGKAGGSPSNNKYTLNNIPVDENLIIRYFVSKVTQNNQPDDINSTGIINITNDNQILNLSGINVKCVYSSNNYTRKYLYKLPERIADIGDVNNITEVHTFVSKLSKTEKSKIYSVLYQISNEPGVLIIQDKTQIGTNTIANGEGSIAIGNNVSTYGLNSYAEGHKTRAIGKYSHSEGLGCPSNIHWVTHVKAVHGDTLNFDSMTIHGASSGSLEAGNIFYVKDKSGTNDLYYKVIKITDSYLQVDKNFDTSVIHGNNTYDLYYAKLGYAYGEASHNEGSSTAADGDCSHAEGSSSQARGIASHAEGFFGKALGQYSHAEGDTTWAKGWASHAEGIHTESIGNNSHAEGDGTKPSGINSHTEGKLTKTLDTLVMDIIISAGSTSFELNSAGWVDVVDDYPVSLINTKNGKKTDSLLELTVNVNDVMNANGFYTGIPISSLPSNFLDEYADYKVVSDDYGILNDYKVTNIRVLGGSNAHAEGEGTVANNIAAHAEGEATRAYGKSSHAEGSGSLAYGEASHAEGFASIAYGDGSHASVGVDNGCDTTLKDIQNIDKNNSDEITKITKISLLWDSSEEPGTVAFGSYSTANGLSCLAAGYGSYAIGYHSKAVGDHSFSQGYMATAAGTASHSEGSNCSAGAIGIPISLNYPHYGTPTDPRIVRDNTTYNMETESWNGITAYSIKIDGLYLGKIPIYNLNKYVNRTCEVFMFGKTITGMFKATAAEAGESDIYINEIMYKELGDYSHAEGEGTVAANSAEHAEGKFNKSNFNKTISSIGIGTSETDRKNALEVLFDGNVYVKGLAAYDYKNDIISGTSYDGTNPGAGNSLQEILKHKLDLSKAVGKIDSKTISRITGQQSDGVIFNVVEGPFKNTASGAGSIASGVSSHAEGEHSHAEGSYTTASGDCAHAEGRATTAKGCCSHAEGSYTTAEGNYAHAEGMGYYLDPAGWAISNVYYTRKIALIENTNEKHYFHVTMGINDLNVGDKISFENTPNVFTILSHSDHRMFEVDAPVSEFLLNNTVKIYILNLGAYGIASHSQGLGALAEGTASFATGVGTVANSFAQTSIGCYNKILSNDSKVDFNPVRELFTVGNGPNNDNRSNAFIVYGNGKIWANGSMVHGADYAEMFEWGDGNPESEERYGYFVTMNNDKIKKAKTGDYVVGIVSSNPSVLGNSPMDWHKKYITDNWGNPVYEEILVPTLSNTGKIILVPTKIKKLNPNYNPELEYIPRQQRKEWASIGMMGQLLVRHDGTLTPGCYCNSNDDGIATKTDVGYYVMKVLNEQQALIILK